MLANEKQFLDKFQQALANRQITKEDLEAGDAGPEKGNAEKDEPPASK
jgi:hypothetical protein